MRSKGVYMKTFILILTLAMSFIGQTFAQDSWPYKCVSYGEGINLTYRLTHISNDHYRMNIIITNPLTNGKIKGVFRLTRHPYYYGVGKLSNGNELSAIISDDFGRFHDLTLTGFSAPTSHSITFSCED